MSIWLFHVLLMLSPHLLYFTPVVLIVLTYLDLIQYRIPMDFLTFSPQLLVNLLMLFVPHDWI